MTKHVSWQVTFVIISGQYPEVDKDDGSTKPMSRDVTGNTS